MKKILVLICVSLLLFSCSKPAQEEVIPFTDILTQQQVKLQDLQENYEMYSSTEFDDSKLLLTGVKNGRLWLGLYNEQGGLIEERNLNSNFNKTVELGYGKTEIMDSYNVLCPTFFNSNLAFWLEPMKDGRSLLRNSFSLRFCFIGKGDILVEKQYCFYKGEAPYWILPGNDCIYIPHFVLPGRYPALDCYDFDAKLIFHSQHKRSEHHPFYDSLYGYFLNPYTLISPETDHCKHYISRFNYIDDSYDFKTFLADDGGGDVSVSEGVLKQDGNKWSYRLKFRYYDGTKDVYTFLIDIDTGVIIEKSLQH